MELLRGFWKRMANRIFYTSSVLPKTRTTDKTAFFTEKAVFSLKIKLFVGMGFFIYDLIDSY
jgi:hypothetical protein